MLHQEVTLQDAVMAIQCVQVSQLASEASLLSSDSLLQSDFPDDQTTFYETMEASIARKLHLSPADFKALKNCSDGKSELTPAALSSSAKASHSLCLDDRTPSKRSQLETTSYPPEVLRSTERKRLSCRPESVSKVSLSRDDLRYSRDVLQSSTVFERNSFSPKITSGGLFELERRYSKFRNEEKSETVPKKWNC